MTTIKKLDKHLMNMIAAGEVVERPAGIVKELVENAIDAKANIIEVQIKNGGIDYIAVTDNGIGMSKDDALLAFERHATSKIASERDLWSIATLGFRGEALPSIASVARVTLISNNQKEATEITINYGELVSNQMVAANVGTKIIIEGLFHNTPARLKSFNSVNYERAVVLSTIEKFAFSYPNLSFILKDEERTLIHTSGSGDLKEILYHVYGKEVARNSFDFADESSDFKISGSLTLPSETRANRNHIQIFINDRMIRAYKLTNDVVAAYRNLMFNDRFPIAIIKLEMDYQLVDVNVHPSKWEVRIAKEKVLSEFIQASIRKALNANLEAVQVKRLKSVEPIYDQLELETKEAYIADPKQSYELSQPIIQTFKEVAVIEQVIEDKTSDLEQVEVIEEIVKKVEEVEEVVTNEFTNLKVIGQLHGKYILAESPDNLYIIDQHAAEERTNFEKIRKQIVNDKIEATGLLVPNIVDIKLSDMYLVETLVETLDSVGFVIEVFSESSIIVREIPLWLIDGDNNAFVLDILEYIKANKNVDLETIRYDVIASKACKASIKFNHHLSNMEMMQVIRNLSECSEPYHCPHGRPTLIKISEKQLIKEFMRWKF